MVFEENKSWRLNDKLLVILVEIFVQANVFFKFFCKNTFLNKKIQSDHISVCESI